MNTCDQYNYVKTKASVESLKKRVGKHVLAILQVRLEPGLHISRKDRKHMVAEHVFKLFTYCALVFM